LVLLAFTTANDVRNNYAPLNYMAPGTNVRKPTFTLDGNGSLEFHPGPAPPDRPWWRELYVGEYLAQRFGWGGSVFVPPANPGVPWPDDPKRLYVPVDMLVYSPEYSPDVAEAWRVTKALVLAIRDEATAHRAGFTTVVVNGPWAHYQDRWNLMMMRHPIARETWDRRKPNRVLAEFLSAQHIPFIDLFDSFAAAKDRAPLFFPTDPHWTPAAHQLAARTVADFLVAQGLVPPGDSREAAAAKSD
jgi:hypothetical protein